MMAPELPEQARPRPPADVEEVDFSARPRPRPVPPAHNVSNDPPPSTPDPQLERLTPQAIEAERSVLGSILLDQQAVERVASMLRPEDFYRIQHADIFAAMLALRDSQTPIDLVTLGDELEARGRLEKIGGPAYLTQLMIETPTAVHAEHYARIVAKRALLRRAIAAAGKIAAVGYEETNDSDAQIAIERIQAIVDELTSSWTAGEVMPHPVSLAEMTAPAEPDAWLIEGFVRPGTLCQITGPPGGAKSWISRQLALAAGAGLATFLDRYPIVRRLRVLVIDEDNGPNEEWRRDEQLLKHLGLSRSDVSTVRRLSLAGVELDQLRWQQWLRDEIEAFGPDLLLLDPISEMHGGKELREDPAFRSLLRFLKALKVDYPAMATVAVHHTRKPASGDKGKERTIEDVRGQWGQTPDVVALMWPLGEERSVWELHKRVPHSKLILQQAESGALVTVADEGTSSNVRAQTDDRVLAAIEAGAERAEEIVHATGLSKAGVYKALSRLASAEIISKRAPYQLLEGD